MSIPPKISPKTTDSQMDEVIRLFCAGDRGAFQLLYKHHVRAIHRYCLRILNDDVLAQDALQETFIKVYQRHADFRGENFPAWIYAIARRVCLNSIRSKKNHDEFDEELCSYSQSSVSDFGMQEVIQKAVMQLPILLREALILREYEGYSYQEIAAIVGGDLSLAKIRVHRARLILRKALAPVVQELRHEL